MSAAHYTYRVTWSPEDNEFVGTVLELPSLSWLSRDEHEAFAGIRELAEEVVADLAKSGELAPEPIAAQDFNGRVLVRMPPSRHRELVIRAAEQGVSMNRYINDVLASA